MNYDLKWLRVGVVTLELKKGYEITCLHTLAIIQAQDIEITSPQ